MIRAPFYARGSTYRIPLTDSCQKYKFRLNARATSEELKAVVASMKMERMKKVEEEKRRTDERYEKSKLQMKMLYEKLKRGRTIQKLPVLERKGISYFKQKHLCVEKPKSTAVEAVSSYANREGGGSKTVPSKQQQSITWSFLKNLVPDSKKVTASFLELDPVLYEEDTEEDKEIFSKLAAKRERCSVDVPRAKLDVSQSQGTHSEYKIQGKVLEKGLMMMRSQLPVSSNVSPTRIDLLKNARDIGEQEEKTAPKSGYAARYILPFRARQKKCM